MSDSTPAGQQFSENDVVSLRRSVYGWTKGSQGTVVADYGAVVLVEFADRRGKTLDLIEVAVEHLDLVEAQVPPQPVEAFNDDAISAQIAEALDRDNGKHEGLADLARAHGFDPGEFGLGKDR